MRALDVRGMSAIQQCVTRNRMRVFANHADWRSAPHARPHESFGQPSGVFANSLSRLLRLAPARTRSSLCNLAPPFRAERGRPSRPALEAAEPSERSRMRIGLVREEPAGQHLYTLRRRVAAGAGRTDDVGPFRLGLLLEGVTDETASLHGEQDGGRRTLLLERIRIF